MSGDGFGDPEGGEWIAVGNIVSRDGFVDPGGGEFLVEVSWFASAEDFELPGLNEPVLVDFPAEWCSPEFAAGFVDPEGGDFMQRRPYHDPDGGEYNRPRRLR